MTMLPAANRAWAADTASDLFGPVIATKNLDFDKRGYVALAKKALTLFTESDDNPNLQTILALAADTAYLYVLTNASFFYVDLSLLTLSEDPHGANAPTFGFQGDMESYQGKPHVSGTTSVASFDRSLIGFVPWTAVITGLSSAYPHPLARMENRNTLLVGDGNVVKQYNSSYVRDTTNELTLPAEFIVTRIIYRNSNAYICTRNIAGGNAKLFVWNATGVGHNGAFGVNADWIYSGCEYGSYCAIVTSGGQNLEFNGAGFRELFHFPVYHAGLPWTSPNAQSNIVGNVASRGMEAVGSVIYLNINGALNLGQASPSGTYLHDMPSGVWKLDPAAGLYHLAAPNYKKHLTLQPTEIASNALKFSAPHEAQTGDPALCFSKSGIVGVNSGQTYYAIYIGPNAIQLALSPAEAKAGKCLALSGTPGGSDLFKLDTYATFGSGQVLNTGALFILKGLLPNQFIGSRLIFGARVGNNALANKGVLMSLGLGRNTGYFVTPKMSAVGTLDLFRNLVAKLPQLNLASQKVTVKYRLADRFGVPTHTAFNGLGGTFASASTFTVDPTLKDIQTVEIGDEVEFISGAAAGYLAHITAIDGTTNPAAWKFTIDVTLPVSAGDTCDFIIDNWTKLPPFTADDPSNAQSFLERAIGKSSALLQLKVALEGRDVAIGELLITNTPNKRPD